MVQQGGQRVDGVDCQSFDQRSLRRVAGRDKEPLVAGSLGHTRHRQHAVDMAHTPIKAQLT